MKKLMIALFSMAITAAHAQTADEVISKYAANMGGLEAFNKVNTVKMTGSVSVQGMDLPITVQILNGKGVRSDVEVMGQTVSSGYSNGNGWKINPMQGASTPTAVSGTELSDLKSQASIASQLMDYKARGHQVELLGQEKTDGVMANKIKLTNKDDNKATIYYINTADNVLIKSVASKSMQGQEMEVSTYYSDLREFNGIKFFMTRSVQMNGEEVQAIVINKVELNVPVDEKSFEMPK